jgi:uncharacterized protein YjbI with pentapeptide repeats
MAGWAELPEGGGGMVQDRGGDDGKAAAGFRDWIGLRAVPDWTRARWLGALLGVVFLLLCVALVGLALAAGISSLVHSIGGAGSGGNLGTSALIAAIIGAPLVIWRTLVAQTTVNLQKEGLMTDRISKAVEQLGAEKTVKEPGKAADGKDITVERTQPNIEVRIGGLYALERIAQDSMTYDKGRDHIRVMEIICAYVRENAPAKDAKQSPHEVFLQLTKETDDGESLGPEDAYVHKDFEAVNKYGWKKEELTVKNLQRWVRELPLARGDIQVALRIIGRRSVDQIAFERGRASAGSIIGYQLDLFAVNIQGANLTRLNFSNAYMPYLRAEGAYVDDADFSGCQLTESHFECADMNRVSLVGAQLNRAWLTGAKLVSANLSRASMVQASMNDTRMNKATLEDAVLDYANMDNAFLNHSKMDRATFIFAQMEGVEMEHASLIDATLAGAKLQKARLHRSNLHGADLNIAVLDGAGLGMVSLDNCKLTGSFRFASFSNTSLEHSNLQGAQLQCAQISHTNFLGANLDRANLSGALIQDATNFESVSLAETKFLGAAVRNIDLTEANLSSYQINQIFGDGSATLSNEASSLRQKWPDHWSLEPLEEYTGREFPFQDRWRAFQRTIGYIPPERK